MLLANRFHIGIVVVELQNSKIDELLWSEAKIQSKGIESIVLAKYIKLRAEQLSKLGILSTRKF